MPHITDHKPGTFCWFEIGTSDQKKAKEFYCSLFGWQATDSPMDDGRMYTMLLLNGSDVAGCYMLDKELLDQHIPPHWMTYVRVESADATALKASQLGGEVLMQPFDIFDIGRMAVIRDPGGAALSLWEAKKHTGTGITMEPGTICWQELQTNNRDEAKEFYIQLFGWTTKADDTEYTEFVFDGNSHAGMMEIRPEWGPVQPNWGVYIMVENCDVSHEKAIALGAKGCVPPTDIEGVGRFATIADPQGAVFSIIEMKEI